MAELHDLLGISASASTSELKREYEQAMARASRALDHQRALALSTAFDRLSPEQRGEMFGRTVSRSQPSFDLPASGWAAVPSSAPTERRRDGRRSSVARRILVGGAVASIVALLAGWLWAQRVQSVPAAPLSPPPDQQIRARVSVTIPLDTPVNGDGLVTVVCEPAPGAAGYDFSARPGRTVGCSNGATPEWGP